MTFVIFFIILSILIVVHEFGHFIAAKKAKVRVEVFSLGFGKKLLGRKAGDTEYKICALPFGGYVKMAGDNSEEAKGAPDEYLSASMAKRFRIIFFGPLFNYLLGIVFFWVVFMAGYTKPLLEPEVGNVRDGMGAKQAGIVAGDIIKSIEGVDIRYWEDLQREILRNQSKEKVKVVVDRAGQPISFDVEIKTDSTGQTGGKQKVKQLGIERATIVVKANVIEAFVLSIKNTYNITATTYKFLWFMITGQVSPKDVVTGPLGMYEITDKIAKQGIVPLFSLMAVLSISLGIFNLLPLPALDGGHIVLLALEKIRRRPLSKKAEEIFNQAGFSFLILIMVLVTINDVAKSGYIHTAKDLFRSAQGLFHKLFSK